MGLLTFLIALAAVTAAHGQEIAHLAGPGANYTPNAVAAIQTVSSNSSGAVTRTATPLSPVPELSGKPPLDDDPSVTLELGAAASWNPTGGAVSFAPNLAAETTPIENWLELEAGVSPFFTRTSTEWDTDLLFKKPWTLSKEAEFMLGVGPEWVYLRRNGRTSNSASGEVAGDFMFWPKGTHRFGWYLEPAYDYSFSTSHEQSVGMSAGLLIGIRRRHR